MKKIYTSLVAVLLFACIPAIAQKGLYFGLAGTIQSTWITNQNNYGLPEMDYKTSFGGAGNLNVGYDFTNHLGIKIEVGYGKFGQKYTDKMGDSTFSREVKVYDLIQIQDGRSHRKILRSHRTAVRHAALSKTELHFER